ncbi:MULTISPECIES: bifunctional cobalt-precorrin-7 (C(5))-methyltransferase/cobalt-precorrin-6B (C(15))-methyltransferase [Streptomyces]|uniref:bifunctional cobalt-precorrin-7 (C(5))-methyltransferase/cobalt-precorrin-6B (C(15))-methyltransferase n=1 Tax=Streptomyces TaxID=1883 RepID=UPI00039CE0F0|nr:MULTISPECIES: bifunctional cobalt-precorrin-7 (C(5))-methyltransferase/cobalt-precorrin-6B (C(15))-methyltransferase [Streptomyces]AOW88424.1 precorrin-6Y methyltransferase [Streptomyces olivaceus]MBZ6108094.1 bifunctional cobalt-precorrin-7 (C(5))-methyltransferase/cobalt-precorrin-6B (C(15))-methyltransferase [Streptomyces olivaceus]MBZ6121978.1 bifunctional cobalt-precorrin-7 (C(5))-methyltransferase/cobalt-precorrin-6B (C(15))-methyltransferase [Streptomyces olivaceus]MBZ6142799.1 bifunc
MTAARSAPTAAVPTAAVLVVGIGADGWEGLPDAARRALLDAEVVLGGPRQLDLLPPECAAERVPWPSPLRPAVPGLLAAHADRRIAVLASGDPMFHGIGRTLTEVLGPGAVRVLPHPSSVSHACARLGWPVEDVQVVTLVGRPTARLAAALHDGRRLLVLSADAGTPGEIAALLRDRGFGPSRMRVLEQLGGVKERTGEAGTADGWPEHPAPDPLNIVAVECRRAPGTLRLGAVPGLPDEAFEHDGQLTKRHVRAATLGALAPAPGELLWDVGGGSGSIAAEWMRTHPSCRAVTVERDPVRAERIVRNADRLGVPGLRVVTGAAPGALTGLPRPDAVFVGGGLTAPGLLEACWDALPVGGRLVANTVTLESEALLADARRRHGGELVRLAVAHAVPVGGFTGWRQAMPVTQWAVEKTPEKSPGADR